MGPIELAYAGIGAVILLIGISRGYAKELGSTTIIMVALFLLTFLQPQITQAISTVAERLFAITDETMQGYWTSTFLTFVFIAIVFASYSGRTLQFRGKQIAPPGGTIISFLVGLLNAYLIAGTLWYYQDEFGYPVQRFFQIAPSELTDFAQAVIDGNFLPPVLFPTAVFWMLPVAVLLVLRVRG